MRLGQSTRLRMTPLSRHRRHCLTWLTENAVPRPDGTSPLPRFLPPFHLTRCPFTHRHRLLLPPALHPHQRRHDSLSMIGTTSVSIARTVALWMSIRTIKGHQANATRLSVKPVAGLHKAHQRRSRATWDRKLRLHLIRSVHNLSPFDETSLSRRCQESHPSSSPTISYPTCAPKPCSRTITFLCRSLVIYRLTGYSHQMLHSGPLTSGDNRSAAWLPHLIQQLVVCLLKACSDWSHRGRDPPHPSRRRSAMGSSVPRDCRLASGTVHEARNVPAMAPPSQSNGAASSVSRPCSLRSRTEATVKRAGIPSRSTLFLGSDRQARSRMLRQLGTRMNPVLLTVAMCREHRLHLGRTSQNWSSRIGSSLHIDIHPQTSVSIWGHSLLSCLLPLQHEQNRAHAAPTRALACCVIRPPLVSHSPPSIIIFHARSFCSSLGSHRLVCYSFASPHLPHRTD